VPSTRNNLRQGLRPTGDGPGRVSSDRNFGWVFAGFTALPALLAWDVGSAPVQWVATSVRSGLPVTLQC